MSKYVAMFDQKVKNKIINWKEFTADSTNPGWELNPGHLFGYHTTRPRRFA